MREAVRTRARLTGGAGEALRRAGFTRRAFLRGSGALVVAFSAGAIVERLGPASATLGAQGGNTPQTLDAWLAVAGDGRVTAFTGRADMGQGMATAQTQLVAEELSVPLSRITLIQCDTALTPDQGTSSGSQGHPVNFNQANLALAGATARRALVDMAAARFNVSATDLEVADGVIRVTRDPARRVDYGTLIGGRHFSMRLAPGAPRKPSSQWTVLGTSVPRIELPDLVTGRFEFVHTVRVPGMLHGRMVRPPAVGAAVMDVDEQSIAGLPGVVRVVVRKNLVGVVAEKPWQALQAAESLRVSWTAGTGLPRQDDLYDHIRRHPTQRDAYAVDSADVDAALARADAVVKATYRHPYQMHGSIGSSCAVADVRGTEATIWSATQAVYPLRSTIAMVLGIPQGGVRVIYRRGAGCYGLNGADAVSYDAAVLSQAVGRPVRVQLSRKDEMAWGENYGSPFVVDQRAGLDRDGHILAWDCESWSASLGSRPGSGTPGNVASGMLLGFEPSAVTARGPAGPPRGWSNGGNAVPSYVTGRVGGTAHGTGLVSSERVLTHAVPSPFFTGPLRSPGRLQNSFAHESFMDELAAHARADPVEYRLRHLRDDRLKTVLSAAARTAGWETRPSPRQASANATVASGRGIACVLYEGDNGYVALVAEADVDLRSGQITARRLVVAQDVGPISNPDGLRNQLEGGALQGLSRALGEEVTWDDHAVTSIDWRTYHSLHVGSVLPAIESVLINQPTGKAMGAGETAITLVAAAVGNAVFDATGVRLRAVPFTPARVLAEIRQKA
jgi:nicotinate dehydrogenase subunit B